MATFKVDYNGDTERPELVISYDADATRLDEKMIERFIELLEEPNISVTATTSVQQDVKTVRIAVVSTGGEVR